VLSGFGNTDTQYHTDGGDNLLLNEGVHDLIISRPKNRGDVTQKTRVQAWCNQN